MNNDDSNLNLKDIPPIAASAEEPKKHGFVTTVGKIISNPIVASPLIGFLVGTGVFIGLKFADTVANNGNMFGSLENISDNM